MQTNSDALTRFRSAYWQAVRNLDPVRLRQWEQSRITLPQLRLLQEIRRQPGITTGELARILGITVSTTSGQVIKLVDKGLIARTTAAADRRQLPLDLAPGGRTLTGELTEVGHPLLDRIAARLGPDLAGVTAALERLGQVGTTVPDDMTACSSTWDAQASAEAIAGGTR